MIIQAYEFGKINIDGKEYTSDAIIYPDKVKGPWIRKEGHMCQLTDLPKDLLKYKPEAVIIGTGYYGIMKVEPEVEEYFKSQEIELYIEPTKEAWRLYNQISQTKKIIALLHLTC